MVIPSQTVGYAPGLPTDLFNPDGTAAIPLFLPFPIIFHYEGEQSVTSDADITDHYIEDNTAIHDQIALKPVTITTHGFIGELNDVPPLALQLLRKQVLNRLTAIGAYAPRASLTATIAYDEAFFFYQTASNAANAAVSAFSSIAGTGETVIGGSLGTTFAPNQNKQQTYFQQFYFYQQNRTPFTIQTPWAVFENMFILHLQPVQDESTAVITDFHVTFKMVRTNQAAALGGLGNIGSAINQSGQLASQARTVVDIGLSIAAIGVGIAAALKVMGVALSPKQNAAAPS